MSENKKATVEEFVKKYNQFNSTELKANYVKSMVDENKYIDYLVKVKYAQDIISISCLDKNGNIKLNSPKRYSLYIHTIINLYTYIEIPENKWNECLDLLEKNNLIEVIMTTISKSEIKRFDTVLKMCQDDLMVNNYEIQGYISRNIEKIKETALITCEPIITSLSKKVDELTKEDLAEIVKILVK